MSTAQLIVRRRIGDIETPVAAMLKLGPPAFGLCCGHHKFIKLAEI